MWGRAFNGEWEGREETEGNSLKRKNSGSWALNLSLAHSNRNFTPQLLTFMYSSWKVKEVWFLSTEQKAASWVKKLFYWLQSLSLPLPPPPPLSGGNKTLRSSYSVTSKHNLQDSPKPGLYLGSVRTWSWRAITTGNSKEAENPSRPCFRNSNQCSPDEYTKHPRFMSTNYTAVVIQSETPRPPWLLDELRHLLTPPQGLHCKSHPLLVHSRRRLARNKMWFLPGEKKY